MISPRGSEPRQRTLSANASRAKLKRSLTLPYTNSTAPHAGSSSSYLMPWSKRVVLSPTSDSTRNWLVPSHRRTDHFVIHAGRRRPGWLACLLMIMGMGLSWFLLSKLLTRLEKPTLVFRREHLQLIWRYVTFSSRTVMGAWVVDTAGLGGRSRADITQAKLQVCRPSIVLIMRPRR